MDMNNFNLLKNEFANLTNQLKSSLENTPSLVLNNLDLGSTATTLSTTSNASCATFANKTNSNTNLSCIDFSKLNQTQSLLENKSDSTNNLLNSINNLKKVACSANPGASNNENFEQTWTNFPKSDSNFYKAETNASKTTPDINSSIKLLLNVTDGITENKADLLHDLNVNSRIKYLEEELSNAQADKEFVWSLWRQLQSSNPDLTNAIGSVVQREKEKYDVKERQAIECLKAKNEEIERLKYSIVTQQNEISELNEKLKRNDLKSVDSEKELDYLRMNTKTYEDKEHMYEQILRGKDDKYEKALCDFNSEKEHLFSKIKDLVNELAKQQENDSQAKIECEQQRQTIDMLNKQIKNANKNYENLMNELNDFRASVDNNLKLENEKLKATVLSKAEKNEELRNELNDLWNKFNLNIDYIDQQDKIIKQLKVIQNELHKTIKSQQVTFENENKELKNMYDQITKKYEESLSSEKHVKSETFIAQQQNQQNQYLQMQKVRLSEKANLDLINAQKFEISQLKLEMDLQMQKFNAKREECEGLSRKLDVFVNGKFGLKQKGQPLNKSAKKSNDPYRPKIDAPTKASTLKRSKSVNFKDKRYIPTNTFQRRPTRYGSEENLFNNSVSNRAISRSKSFERNSSKQDRTILDEKYQAFESRLEKVKLYYDNLCKAKDQQLETLRISHHRRLERLNSLEKQYKLLKDHLKSYTGSEKTPNETAVNKHISNENQIIGYTRKDNESLWNEAKFLRKENESLLKENFSIKEEIDLLKVKSDEQNEQIENLKMEVNLRLDSKQENYDKLVNNCEKELKITKEKLRTSNDELKSLKLKIDDLDKNCDELVDERIKYVDLCTKLSNENKKLYKKWFQSRKTDSKYRMLLIDQMNKCSQAKIKRKVFQKKSMANSNEISSCSSSESLSDSMSDIKIVKVNRLKESVDANSKLKLKKNASQTIQMGKKKLAKLESTINSLKKQLNVARDEKLEACNLLLKTKSENEKLTKELETLDSKHKQLKLQKEANNAVESSSLKKLEADLKEKEESMRKLEENKKSSDGKLKQLNIDFTKQLNANKTLKSENEKLIDKLKINEEKLNHTERDNNQKKQLIEFYKKKIEELNEKERNDAMKEEMTSSDNALVNDLKSQLKKYNESNEKSKNEMKSLKTRLQSVQEEKTSLEQKLDQAEKSLAESNAKLAQLKREKAKLDSNLKQSKNKINELEAFTNELEQTAQSKLQDLSKISQDTLTAAQIRLKYAFKSVEDYEKVMILLYESLLNRCMELRKKIKSKKALELSQKSKNSKSDVNIDTNMKMAMSLASSVLNLTATELDDIMSTSIHETSMNKNKSSKSEIDEKMMKEDEINHRKSCKKLLFEFEQCLNESKKEKEMIFDGVHVDENLYEPENFNKNILELIVKRLDEVLSYERELASLKVE